VTARRSTQAYANGRKRELARRQAKQTAYTQEFNDPVIKVLNSHFDKSGQQYTKFPTGKV
jgi:hypothetical protein